jgi:hypothetical protein
MFASRRTVLLAAIAGSSLAGIAAAQSDSLVAIDAPGRSITRFAVTPDGAQVAYERRSAASGHDDVFVLDLRALEDRIVEPRASLYENETFVSISDDGRRVGYIEQNGTSTVQWSFDRVTGLDSSMGTIPVTETPTASRLSPDGTRCAVVSRVNAAPNRHRLRFFGPGTTTGYVESNRIELAPAGRAWDSASGWVAVSTESTSPGGGILRAVVKVMATTGAATSLTCGLNDRMATLSTVPGTSTQKVTFLRTTTSPTLSTSVMQMTVGGACASAVSLGVVGTATVGSVAASGDGSVVLVATDRLGGWDVWSLTASTGTWTDLTQRDATLPFLAPWPDMEADIAWFGSPDATGRLRIEAVNVTAPSYAVYARIAEPVPPFEASGAWCGGFSNPSLLCQGMVTSTDSRDLHLIGLQTVTTTSGQLVAVDGPHVMTVPDSSDAVWTGFPVVCPWPGGTLRMQTTFVDPTVPQDDVVTTVIEVPAPGC